MDVERAWTCKELPESQHEELTLDPVVLIGASKVSASRTILTLTPRFPSLVQQHRQEHECLRQKREVTLSNLQHLSKKKGTAQCVKLSLISELLRSSSRNIFLERIEKTARKGPSRYGAVGWNGGGGVGWSEIMKIFLSFDRFLFEAAVWHQRSNWRYKNASPQAGSN